MLTRRQFLQSTAALALVAGLGAYGFRRGTRRPRYVISTQSFYFSPQEIRSLATEPERRLPGLADTDRRSLITVVNDDGTGLRRFLLPLHYHVATHSPATGLLYLVGNHRPSAVVGLDPDTLELASVTASPRSDDPRNFAGHALPVPGTDVVAFGMNHFELGKYDQVSLRDARTMREIQAFSTYGFQVHDLRLTSDGKYFVCGHYGSYLGQGIYRGMGMYDGQARYQKVNSVYPSSVTLVDARSGARSRLLSYEDPDQMGHADSGPNYEIFMPHRPARLKSRPDLERHPRFREGRWDGPEDGEFSPRPRSVGICVLYDPRFREVIVPVRSSLRIEVTDAAEGKVRSVDLAGQLPWLKTLKHSFCGLEFHPDGRHYVLSTPDGILALERGTHRLNAGMSFPLPLLAHSHMLIC